jgi:DNA-binding NtrC family response regulator
MPGYPAGYVDPTTLPPADGTAPGRHDAAAEVTGLVVLWSRDEPGRIGEAILLPAGDREPWTFGRGEALPEHGARRISLVRQRPGELLRVGPLECPRVSRAQLRLAMVPGAGLTVENVGSCAMLHGGREVTRAEVAPGQTLALHNELLFLCVRRTLVAPSAEERALPPHPFGEADELGLVGESQAAWELRLRILAVARQRFHTLILGESGCGKEIVAQAIHARSARGGRPMIARNAATIPEGLADAELFGNLRNYPNVGMSERPGLVGQAHQSTLFLDEFADLPSGVQTRFLRLMDDGEYHRLGEATARRSDLRIVAATNRPASHIKHDVLARLKVRVTVPDLNARREDIPLLVAHLLRRHARSDQSLARRFFSGGDLKSAPLVSPLLIEALVKHRYTAHVRELDALLIRAALEGEGRYLEAPPDLLRSLEGQAPAPAASSFLSSSSSSSPPSQSSSSSSSSSSSAPSADAQLEGLSSHERLRLTLLRHHHFSPTQCGRDPAYPGNRQSADLHLRHLLCRALQQSAWELEGAAVLLAGTAERPMRDKAAARIERFLVNLRARLAAETEPELRRGLVAEWKGNVEIVLRLVEALRAGKVSPPRAGSQTSPSS